MVQVTKNDNFRKIQNFDKFNFSMSRNVHFAKRFLIETK